MLSSTIFPQNQNSTILTSRRWNKYTILYVGFSPGNHWFNIKELTRDIADNFSQKQIRKIYQKIYVSFFIIVGCYLQILLFINEG